MEGLPIYGEYYEYPGGFLTDAEAAHSSRLRMEHEDSSQSSCSGRGTIPWFSPGKLFRTTASAETHRIVWVAHEAWDDSHVREYKNRFRCQPGRAVVRPPIRTPKPKMVGPQTAVVVGPNGADVGSGGQPFHTDSAGRVRVRFPWDRYRGADREASAWIPVAHRWGGAGYGRVSVHRIGQQVVLEFLDGDVDRPIVTGVVYNAPADMPADPVAHPERSTWQSQSTDAKAGGHLIRMDDAAGAEKLVVASQRDLFLHALNDFIRACGGNALERVAGTWTVAADKGAVIDGGTLVRLEAEQLTHKAKEILLLTDGGSIHIGPAGVTIKGISVKINCAGADPIAEALAPVPTPDELKNRLQ